MEDILVRNYDTLSIEERARAIEEAWRLGWESARTYAWSHDDDLGLLVVEPRDYIIFIVEDAYIFGECSEETYRTWKEASDEELEAGPRVQAFVRAWAEEIKEFKEEW